MSKSKPTPAVVVQTPQGTRTHSGTPPQPIQAPIQASVQGCTFNNSGLGVGVSRSMNKYDHLGCYKHKDHRLYKVLDRACPCTFDGVPLLVTNHKSGDEIRIYGHDIVLINKKRTICVSNVLRLVEKQQSVIKSLQRKVKRLEKKSRKK